jgi:predicted DNA-binding transcriptional regulator AlpA
MAGRTSKPATDRQKLITLQQASAEYGPPYHSLYDLINRGHLPSVRLGDTKRIWVRRSDVEQLIERSTVQIDPLELTTRAS